MTFFDNRILVLYNLKTHKHAVPRDKLLADTFCNDHELRCTFADTLIKKCLSQEKNVLRFGCIIEVVFSLCNMKIGRVRHFARLDYFARAMACGANCFLSVVSHTYCQELEAAFKETFCVIN